jgi:hypothetical protein
MIGNRYFYELNEGELKSQDLDEGVREQTDPQNPPYILDSLEETEFKCTAVNPPQGGEGLFSERQFAECDISENSSPLSNIFQDIHPHHNRAYQSFSYHFFPPENHAR